MSERADSPRLLIVETSGRTAQVALARGDELLAARRLDDARRHARDLVPAVDDLLRGQGWRPRELHAVVVGLGPGSYTGLRVGLMSARTLCYATGCVLIGVETFAAIALQAAADRLDVLADAQQDRAYVQSFRRAAPGAAPAASTPLTIRSVSEWLAGRDAGAWVSGPGVEAHSRRLPEGLPLVEEGLRAPRPESLLQIGLARYRAGGGDDVWSLEPIYLRPSAAEEQWQRRRRG